MSHDVGNHGPALLVASIIVTAILVILMVETAYRLSTP